jgi:hypothetical protein
VISLRSITLIDISSLESERAGDVDFTATRPRHTRAARSG